MIRRLWTEFKGFAFKGNVVDLAVAFILGAAFNGVVKSFSDNVLMKLAESVVGAPDNYRMWKWGNVEIGVFISNLVNFMFIAVSMFILVVKFRQYLMKPVSPTPATQQCPMCTETISANAKRCPRCTSLIAGQEEKTSRPS